MNYQAKKNSLEKDYYGFNSALKIIEPEIMACNLPLKLDPYLGCEHNCTYCYARGILYRYKNWHEGIVKHIDPELLRKRLDKILISSQEPRNPINRALWYRFPIRIGTNTDPFTPYEAECKVTKRILEILNEYEYPYILNTKSDMVAEEEYVNLLKNTPKGAIVQFTIISLNTDLIEKIEPGAPALRKRLEAMKTLTEKGIYTQTRISPIIPKYTDDVESMRALLKVLKSSGCQDVIVEYLRYNSFIRKWISEAMGMPESHLDNIYSEEYRECSSSFPDCCQKNRNRFGCSWNPHPKMVNGYIRMPLRLKLERYRLFKEEARKVGLRLYVCSEEFPEINDCVNCCGIKGEEAKKHLKFDHDNEACANTLPCYIKEKGEVTSEEVLNDFFSIDRETFAKRFDRLDEYLVNVKKGQKGWIYDHNFPV